jgi:hypothetical protein
MTTHPLRLVALLFASCLLSGCTLVGAGIGAATKTTTERHHGFENTPLAWENLSDHSLVQFQFDQGTIIEGRWLADHSLARTSGQRPSGGVGMIPFQR